MKSVLVLSLLFPDNKDISRGIFVLDYMKSLKGKYNFIFINLRLSHSSSVVIQNTDLHTQIIFQQKLIFSKWISYLLAILFMQRYIKREYNNIDLIHTHESLILGFLAARLKKYYKAPLIVSEHTGPFSKMTRNFAVKRICQIVYKKSDFILPVSYHTYKEIKDSGFIINKFNILGNPVDTNTFNISNIKNDSKDLYFIFSSNLSSYKNCYKTLIAFESLLTEYADWKFIIIGDGEEMNKIREKLNSSLSLSERVYLLGKCDRKTISDYMAKSRFFVLPSEHESFCISYCEALAAGLPIIAGKNTGPLDYLKEEHGVLLEKINQETIRQALVFMFKNYYRYDSHSLRKIIEDSYSLSNFGDKLGSLYEQIINKCAESQVY